MLLAFGIVAALFERERSNLGQVVDAAIVDGVSSMMSFFDGLQDAGRISLDRRENMLAGGAPFYRTYQCRDGREVAIGSLETKRSEGHTSHVQPLMRTLYAVFCLKKKIPNTTP